MSLDRGRREKHDHSHMKIILCIGKRTYCFLLWVPLFLWGYCGPVLAVPRIVCTPDTYDFGSHGVNASLTHTFILENQGDQPLVIGRVRGCCGATTVLNDSVIAPGSNTTLLVAFSLKGRNGLVSKNVFVTSNDPTNSYLHLRLTASVLKTVEGGGGTSVSTASLPSEVSAATEYTDLVAVPSSITLVQQEGHSEPATRYIAVRSRSQKPFKIIGLGLPVADLSQSISSLEGTTGSRIEIKGLLPLEMLDGAQIFIQTDRKDEPVLVISIRILRTSNIVDSM